MSVLYYTFIASVNDGAGELVGGIVFEQTRRREHDLLVAVDAEDLAR